PSRRVVGFGFLIRRLDAGATGGQNLQDNVMPPGMIAGNGGMFLSKLSDTNSPASAPLIVDNVISGPGPKYDFYDATLQSGNVTSGNGGRHHSAHTVGTDGKQLGGNIMFLDTHVTWRRFVEMKPRYTEPQTSRACWWY